MEIILIKEVSSLGYAGDIVRVKDGYARNYLLPQKLGVRKTPKALERLEQQKKDFQEKVKETKAHYQSVVEKFQEIEEVEIHTLASKEGKIYGSVTAEMICKRLKDHHDIDIDKKKIVIRNALKVIGNYTIDVQLDKKIKTSFNLSIRLAES